MLVWRENDGIADASVTQATDIVTVDREKIIILFIYCLIGGSILIS